METVKGPDSLEKELERMVGLYQLPLLRLCYAYLHDEELAKDLSFVAYDDTIMLKLTDQ